MSGVGILCFTASYAIALCLEVSRGFFRSSVRNLFALLWILAGLTAHTAYLYYHQAAALGPVGDAESYFFVSAWGVVLVSLYWAWFHPQTPFGLILLPIALLLILGGILASVLPQPDPLPTVLPEMSLWKRIHAGTFFLATLSVCVGFVAGVLYLFQDRRLRLKKPPLSRFNLPTIEWSLSICRQAAGASLILLGACIFSGTLLNVAPSKMSGSVTLFDPLVVGTISIFTLLLFSFGVCSVRFCRKTGGKHVAALTLLAFLLLCCMLILAVWLRNAHWKRPKSPKADRPVSQATAPSIPPLSHGVSLIAKEVVL